MANTCRGCGAKMRWARNESSGKNIPLDPEPVPDGNLVLVRCDPSEPMTVRALRKEDPDPDPSLPRYVAHFKTCPLADSFRRKDQGADAR